MKNKIIVFLCMIILLSACGSDSSGDSKVNVTEPIVAGDYKILSSYASSNSRQTHVEFNRGWYDRETIGKGLMHYSKQHFSPDSYYLMEGQILKRGDLQINVPEGPEVDKEGLLGRKSSENEHGLNPESDSSFLISKTPEQTIKVGRSTTPIVDIFEIDFTKEASSDPEIDGISLAIVLSPNVLDAQDKEHAISDDVLFTIGEEAAITLVDYLRKMPEIGNKTPIYITLFKAESSDDSLPGTFIAEAYAKDSVSMSKLNEEWMIFSSENATKKDAVIAQQFDALKNELFMIVPNDIGVVGKGKFVDDKIDTLQITITSQAKTYTESSAIIQTVNESLNNFENDDIEISVRFYNDGEAYAMIKREKGTKDTTVIMY
ncbi:protein involved in sex pheromone biosynthesis [Breznakia sp. PF5-3]|uniref:CamS family sex pheromone protein n=1 Tax=unclassified Breznakia TaxID=2623764 RepID=UPI002405F521|nr:MULTISPECIES: CamS family sex pheromone protein [unclassified Breznakia]MDF9823757.1 protein involved in sex pheromone biosynthesis [Breznakia sp. PM6-1]MDF9834555.1 protein involved in sex pheromone biosynthesis [Breznakia sp. PF5-3]MDF9838252.1 protein involved in sex pheromone biosynthesis [Breznakia sp. PFB2-8]MDF9860268.1 protein involved in sex pheromone biosynthesis [Breznakia sp. PH5-24]